MSPVGVMEAHNGPNVEAEVRFLYGVLDEAGASLVHTAMFKTI